MAKMDTSRSSTSRKLLLYNVDEHIPMVKSGEDNQRIQLKRMLTMGPVPTPYTIVQHSFQLTFRERRMENFLMLFISRA